MTKTFYKEKRCLANLKPHEKPSSWRVWKITNAIKSGLEIPLISIAIDGMILDGHGRYFAYRRILGIIEVEVMKCNP
jgi:ParB-like chromosome segregation protein Spo0J